MIRRILSSNRGSTLSMVLVVLFVLSILGTTLISVAVTNYKFKIVDSNAKKSLYLSEAGLHEAHALIEKQIHEAIKAANLTVSQNINNEVEKSKYIDTNNEKVYPWEDALNGYDGLNKTAEAWFKKAYKDYLNTNLKTVLENTANYTNTFNLVSGGSFTVILSSISNFGSNDNPMSFNLQISYPYENVQKRVSQKFEIKVAEFNRTYYWSQEEYRINDSELSNYAISAEKDIYFDEGNVTIIGPVYAYGKEGGEGISVASDQLNINGNVITNQTVKIVQNNVDLNIAGNVFCRELEVPEGIQNAKLSMISLYTEDDLVLNGSSSTIEMTGNYYGFNDGRVRSSTARARPIEYSSSTTHDSSSSIVINASDIGTNSFISIAGDVAIGGTAYFRSAVTDVGIPFQTGESISIAGNYLAYLDGVTLTNPPFQYEASNIGRKDYEYHYDPSDYSKYTIEALPERFINDNKILTASHKGELFKLVSNESGLPFTLVTGGNNGLNIDYANNKVKYTRGAYIAKGAVRSQVGTEAIWSALHDSIAETYYTEMDRIVKVTDVFQYPEYIVKEIKNASSEICYINSNAGESVALIGKNAAATPPPTTDTYRFGTDFNDHKISGIIVAAGDVYIYGEMNFTGIIASGGSVYFMDDKPKTITLDKNIVVTANPNVGVDNNVLSYNKYRADGGDYADLITVSEWKHY